MKGFVQDIEDLAVKNHDCRRALYTARHCQLVVMSLKPNEEIGASSQTALTAHRVLKAEHGDQDGLLPAATHALQECFEIRHVTLHLEFVDWPSDGGC